MAADEAQIQRELEAQQAELAYHLNNEVPHACQTILARLTASSGHLAEASVKLEFESSRVNNVEGESGNWHGLRGLGRMEGPKITSGGIEVKFSKFNHGKAVKTSIAVAAPWLLEQVQNAHNHIQLATEELVVLCEEKNSASIKDVFEIITAVSTSINHAKEELVMLSRHSNLRPSHGPQVFSPALPADLFVDFCVDRSTLVVAAYHVTAASKHQGEAPPPASTAAVSGGGLIDKAQGGASISGQTFFLRGQWVSVVEYSECRVELKALVEALEELAHAYRAAIRLRDKTIAHSNFF